MTWWRRLWPRSLAARVVLVQGLAILLAAIALPLGGARVLRHAAVGEQRRVLEQQAASIAAGFGRGRDGGWHVRLPAPLAEAYGSSYDGRAFAVVDRHDGPVAGSPFADSIPWERVPLGARTEGFSLPPFSGVTLPVTRAGTRFWVIVAQDENGPGVILGRVVEQALERFVAIVLPLLLAFAVLNYFLLRRLIVSVERASAAAATIGADSLHVRIDEARVPSEVAPLVRATNALVARLEESFAGQAQFVGNVVHELRTPLGTLRMQADAVTDAALRARIDAQVDRIGHVVTQLRDLASLEDASRLTRVAFDLAGVATDTVVEWAPQAMASGHSIALDRPDAAVTVGGNPTLAALAVANLVANAVRHTPDGTAIRVIVAGTTLVVEDDGPGVHQFEADQLTRRFWRADHRRSDSAGLGLAIVRRIMEVGGGTFAVAAAPSGGARFELTFPAA